MAIAPSSFDIDAAGTGEQALVLRHQAGDADAFATIVGLYYADLLRCAKRKLDQPADAEDAVQETLLRAFRGLDKFGDGGEWRLGGWLHRILGNVCTDQGLRRQLATRTAGRLAGLPEDSGDDVAELVSDPVALAAVRRAVASLPANQRQAFVLRIVDDLPYPEVAAQLGITEGNARARVQRARATLRRALSDAGPISGALAVIPLLFRVSLHRLLRHGVEPTTATTGSPTPSSATGTLSMVSSATPAATAGPGAISGVINSSVTSGVQLVGQLAAGPVGQAAVVASSIGGGKGSTVLKLAAGLATAGALAIPSGAGSQRPKVNPSTTTSTSAPGIATTETAGTTEADGTSSGGSAGATSSPGPSSPTHAAASGTTPPASSAATTVSLPTWVTLAASVVYGASNPASGTAGTGTGPGTGGTAGGNTSTSSTGSSSSTSSSSSAPTGTEVAVSGSTGTQPSTSDGTAGSSPGSSSPTTTTGSGSGSKPTGTATAPISALPAGTCSTVPGFPGVDAATPAPPLSSTTIIDTLNSGPVDLDNVSTSTAFGGAGSITMGAGDVGTPVNFTVGTCLAQSGSILAVDLTGADGTEVQLIGSLVAVPKATSPTGSSDPAAGTSADTTYLFRGSATQIGGDFLEGQLPWHLTPDFVAELQISQPANTAELTVDFVQSATTTGNTAPATSGQTGGPTSSDGSPGSAGPAG